MTVYHGVVLSDTDFRVWRGSRPFRAARSLRVWDHSPDGFAWGYQGSGPAQLALAILLAEGLPAELAVRLHQPFKRLVISGLPREVGACWSLTSDLVAATVTLLTAPPDAPLCVGAGEEAGRA